jgi:hypothetical protein
MADDFSVFTIERVVIHQVFEQRGGSEAVDPDLGVELTVLESHARKTLENRVVKSLGHNSHGTEMHFHDVSDRGFFAIATRLLDSDDVKYVSESHVIAGMLTSAQSGKNTPGGALAIIQGVTGQSESRFLAVIKAEPDDGFTVDKSTGHPTMKYLTNLLLTKTQRLYKIGFLIERNKKDDGDEYSVGDFGVYVYDDNLNIRTETGAAKYFYMIFLGLKKSPSDKVTTKTFYEETKKYIKKSSLLDKEKKIDLLQSLYSTLKTDVQNVISVSGFAERFMPAEVQSDYKEKMLKKGLPAQSFTRDLTAIPGGLKMRKVRLTGDVTISMPSESYGSAVKIDSELTTSNETVIRIKGSIVEEGP